MSVFQLNDEEETSQEEAKQDLAWMIIFTDLISLMLTFFVLLFSMSLIKIDSWSDVINSLKASLNASSTRVLTSATSGYSLPTVFQKGAINLDYLISVLKESISEDELLVNSQLMRLEDRLVIALPGDLLFQPGKASLDEEAKKALFNLGGVLRNVKNQIGINGHTDPKPLKSKNYTSNWELSIGRATAVANALQRSGYTEEIISFGYASSRFDELPELPEIERSALGRRVDIVIFPTVGDS